jgi:hypothetical protein
MSELGHCVVFWFAGLLAGVLLGWMMGRRAVGRAPPRLEPHRQRQSA